VHWENIFSIKTCICGKNFKLTEISAWKFVIKQYTQVSECLFSSSKSGGKFSKSPARAAQLKLCHCCQVAGKFHNLATVAKICAKSFFKYFPHWIQDISPIVLANSTKKIGVFPHKFVKNIFRPLFCHFWEPFFWRKLKKTCFDH
jgi:protein-arginine kinase activator protein McsA